MRKRNKCFYFILIILILFGVSVGYAAINRTLNITGNSEVSKNTWDIHFENVMVTYGSVTAIKEPVLDNTNLSVDFSFNLDLPGDFYEFTVDVLNKGTIDAMIDSISKTPELTDFQKKYLNYTIEYENGEAISSKQLLASYSLVRIKVRVEYRTDIAESDLPSVFETLNLGFTVNYVQGDISASKVNDNGVKKYVSADGDINEIGTVVTIGTEKFYVIGTNEFNVTLLSMYNLYVGGSYDISTGTWNAYGEEATGMQDERMKGYVNGASVLEGTINFSNESYGKSNVAILVNAYKDKLEKLFDVSVIDAEIISSYYLNREQFNCNFTSEGSYLCSNDKYKWFYSTTYWTMDSKSTTLDDFMWTVFSDGKVDIVLPNSFGVAGVRPVITISRNEIDNGESDVISFSVVDSNWKIIKLKALAGMTWSEFVNSNYNLKFGALKIYEDYATFNNNNYRITDINLNEVLKNEKIIENYRYYFKYVYVGGTAEPE